MDNPLETNPPYPQELSFVLRLHRCSGLPGLGVMGRLQHLASGNQVDFDSVDGLAAALQAAIGRPQRMS